MAQKRRSGSRKTSGGRTDTSAPTGRPPKSAKKTSRRTSGSQPSSDASVPVEVARAVGTVASALRARWYVFGAQAASVWGRPRLTTDVDITIELQPQRIAELLLAARKAGLVPREAEVEALAEQTRVVPLRAVKQDIPVDLVLAGSGLEARFLDRARNVSFGKARIPFISPEDLILTKVLAGRSKDLDDVVGVLHQRLDELDLDYVRGTLREIEEAIDAPGLIDSFERLARI